MTEDETIVRKLTVVAFLRYGSSVAAFAPESTAGYAEVNR